jgi:hypothetical protein
MTAAAPTADAFIPAFAPAAKPTALRSLMRMWEEEAAVEDHESETDLMVMLSGMVGPHATAIDD